MKAALLGKKRWLRRLVHFFLFILLFLLWLDGPGIRWLGPKVAAHFARKYGVETSLVISGRVTMNLALHNIHAKGGPINDISISEVRPKYHFFRAIMGEFGGIDIRCLTLHCDLDKKFPSRDDDPHSAQESFNLAKWIDTLRVQQQKLRRWQLHVDTARVAIEQGGDSLLKWDALVIEHAANVDAWEFMLAGLQWKNQQQLPRRQARLAWSADAVELDKIDLMQNVSLRDMRLSLTSVDEIMLHARLQLDQSSWLLKSSPGFQQVSITMDQGRLALENVARLSGRDLPVAGVLERFQLIVIPRGYSLAQPSEMAALRVDFSMEMLMKNIDYKNFRVDSLNCQVKKSAENITSNVRATAFGGEFLLNAKGRWDQDPASLADLGKAWLEWRCSIPQCQKILETTRPHWGASDKQASVRAPLAALSFVGESRMQGQKFDLIKAQLLLDHEEEKLPDVSLALESADADAWKLKLSTTGIEAEAACSLQGRTYDAQMRLAAMRPDAFNDTVAWLGLSLPAGMKADLRWSGRGDLQEEKHHGTCWLESFHWRRSEGDIRVDSLLSYQWPQYAALRDFRAVMGKQEIRMDAHYEADTLTVSRLQHRVDGRTLLQGTARLPVPPGWNRRAFFSQENPWALSVKSEVLPLSLANQWLPANAPLPISGMLDCDIDVNGSPSAPNISVRCNLKDIRHYQHQKLDAADLALTLSTHQQVLNLTGELTSARTAPILMSAQMPFHPQQWQAAPDLFKKEKINAKITIPKVNLQRFADLAPQVKNLSGELSGSAELGGVIEKPEFTGQLALDGFAVDFDIKNVPPIGKGMARINFNSNQVRIERMQLELAAGNLAVSGLLDHSATSPQLDFRIKGTSLPLWRDDAIISRANADLTLSGPINAARISGNLAIIDSLLYKDIEILPIGKPFTLPQAAALPTLDAKATDRITKIPAPYGDWLVDVQVKTADPFLIRGNLARGEITVDCRIGGTLADPKPSGSAQIRDLTAALPLSRLHVDSGFLRLTPQSGIDPVLDIRGTSRVSSYDVTLYLYGQSSAPKILLTSEPPLPENEIMTLLATGTTTKGLGDGSMAQSRAMQLLIEEFRRGRLPIGKRLAPLLGKLDKVELAVGEPDPYSGKKRASAKVPIWGNWFLSGAVDGQGQTRSLLMFQLNFR